MAYIEWIRSRVGHRKIFLAFASIVLRDDQGHVLLQRRTDFDFWGLPGGVLELGEDLQSCARRELLEETGLTAARLSLVGVYTDPRYATAYPNGDQVQQYTVCFQGLVNGGKMQPDGVETSEQRFVSTDQIPALPMPEYYTTMIRDAIRGGTPAFLPPYSVSEPINQIEDIRPLIGHAPLIGVGATAISRREDGRLLMVQRSDTQEWVFPGGYTHLGENVAQTAVRETEEESGYQVKPERILGIYSPKSLWTYTGGDQVQSVVTIFLTQVIGGKPRPDQVETCDIAWMTATQISTLHTHPLLARKNQAVLAHLEHGYFVI
jgi:8-oxo-dGTP diphosphatase